MRRGAFDELPQAEGRRITAGFYIILAAYLLEDNNGQINDMYLYHQGPYAWRGRRNRNAGQGEELHAPLQRIGSLLLVIHSKDICSLFRTLKERIRYELSVHVLQRFRRKKT